MADEPLWFIRSIEGERPGPWVQVEPGHLAQLRDQVSQQPNALELAQLQRLQPLQTLPPGQRPDLAEAARNAVRVLSEFNAAQAGRGHVVLPMQLASSWLSAALRASTDGPSWPSEHYDDEQRSWCEGYTRECGYPPLMDDYEAGRESFDDAMEKSNRWSEQRGRVGPMNARKLPIPGRGASPAPALAAAPKPSRVSEPGAMPASIIPAAEFDAAALYLPPNLDPDRLAGLRMVRVDGVPVADAARSLGIKYTALWYLNRQFTKTLASYGRVKEELMRRGISPSDEEIGHP